MKFKTIAMAGLAGLLATKVAAQVTANVDVNSSYIARGMVFGPGPAVQPSVTVVSGQFTGIAWLNHDPNLGLNEIDLFLRLAHNFGNVRLEASYGKDVFWHSNLSETQELSISATRGNLNAFLVHDFRSGKGQYAELSYTRPATRALPIVARVALGYNNHYFKPSSSFSHLEAKVQAPISVAGFTITTSASYLKALQANFQDKAVFGISVTRTF